MNPSDYRICLDVQQPHGAVELDMKQGDTNRRICITLTDGGRPYLPGEGCCAVFTAKKPDEKVIYNQCTVENNTVVYGVTAQTTACAGTVRCELRLYSREPQLDEQGRPIPGEDCQLLTSAAFTIAVHPQVCQDADVVASVPESTVLEALVSVAETAIEECETATQQAGTVASYADQAGDHARQEAENAAEAAAKANAVAQQVQEKLDSGAFIGPQGEKGDPGQVNIDDSTVAGDSTWSSEKITEFVTETSALVHIDCDAVSGLVTVNRTHAEIAALVNNRTHLQVQLFYMETAGDETLAVNGMWMKRDLYGDAFVFCFSGIGDIVLQSDDTAFWVSPPGNVRYDAAQELDEAQQAQARENIGAVDSAFMQEKLDQAEVDLIDKLCPAFSESGAVVTCEPVEEYPLQAVSQIAPVQAGSGDPGPDNIRAISGHTAVQLTRAGKNLFDDVGWFESHGFTPQEDGSWLGRLVNEICFTNTAKKAGSMYLTATAQTNDNTVPFYLVAYYTDGTTSSSLAFYAADAFAPKTITTDPTKTVDRIKWTYGSGGSYYIKDVMISFVDGEYEPYKGDTFTVDLGQTVYGGTLNWQTGALTVDKLTKTFDGTEEIILTGSADNNYANYRFRYTQADLGAAKYTEESYCSHWTYKSSVYNSAPDEVGHTVHDQWAFFRLGSASTITTADAFKALLAEQHAAGTPVQVCYQLATPITVQLTPQEIKALAGVNTVWSDTGDTQVTGRADPVAQMQKLKNAILALGGNV